MQKSKDDMLQALNRHLPASAAASQPAAKIGPSNDDIIVDAEEDYDFARQHIKKLIDTSDEAIATMHDLARDAEHPRAFEVLAAMIKSAADMNSQLLALQKERKKIIQEPIVGKVENNSTTNNNSIFVGTTTQLQQLLQDHKNKQTIDVS